MQLNISPRTEGKLQKGKKDVWVALECLFCFGILQLQEKVQQHMTVYETSLVQRIKTPKPG